MVSVARLDWLVHQVHGGRCVNVTFSYNAKLQREKIKFVLDANSPTAASIYRPCIFGALSAVAQAVEFAVVTDKGHRSSDGRTVVEFWVAQPSMRGLGTAIRTPHVDAAAQGDVVQGTYVCSSENLARVNGCSTSSRNCDYNRDAQLELGGGGSVQYQDIVNKAEPVTASSV